jgi:F0F1-type ATP synthase assembly protein I
MALQNDKKIPPKKPKRSASTTLLRFTDMAFRMGVTIALGTWFGKWLDGKMSMAKPIFLPVFALLSVVIAMYMVIRDAQAAKNE